MASTSSFRRNVPVETGASVILPGFRWFEAVSLDEGGDVGYTIGAQRPLSQWSARSFAEGEDTIYSPGLLTYERELRLILQDWEQIVDHFTAPAPDGEVEVSYEYMAQAAVQASHLPDVDLGEGDLQSLASISTDFSQALGIEYDEE